jgi:quercetin dioxygenase-like cupin family protein
MSDTTVKKIDSRHSPLGEQGQKYLVSGKGLAMRMWEAVSPGEDKPEVSRPYETVGYVIQGRAELHSEGQVVTLEQGDSWLVPEGARHTYRILEPFTAIEVTHPPAHLKGRDETQ